MKYQELTALTVGALLVGIGSVQAEMALSGEELNTTYTYSAPSEGDFENDVEQSEIVVHGSTQVLDADHDQIDLRIGGTFQLNFWSFDDDRIDDISLYKFLVPITGTAMVRDDIAITGEVVPGIRSDLKEVDGDDFSATGSLFGTFDYAPDLKFVLGLGYTEHFGDPRAIPIGGVIWQATDQWLVNAVFPRPKVTYSFNDDLNAFLAGEPTGGQWNVSHQEDSGNQVDLELKGYRVGIGGEYQVMKGGWLYAMVGAETQREINLAINDDSLRGDVDMDDAAFAQIGFRLK